MRFACPSCGESIGVNITFGKKIKVLGADDMDFRGPFDGSCPFVDLHIDFPVSFEKYEMGNTPFMRAVGRIGHENFSFHAMRLNALNALYPMTDELERIFRLYSKNHKLFTTLCKSRFGEEVESSNQEDIDAALYRVIAKAFFPFSMPHDSGEAVDKYLSVTKKLWSNNRKEFDLFIKELDESNFLANIRTDCLEIYPRILRAELALRPALFLDFDSELKVGKIAFRVSVDDFQMHKDLYKDISEVMSRQLVLVAGINNLIHRGDHNLFGDHGKNTPISLNKFADVPYGNKLEYLDSSWYVIDDGVADNQLRNSIAHYKAEYDEIEQVITYFPRKEGIKQEKAETISFLSFMRKLLVSYREMHRMHHLIKCLSYYRLLMYRAVK